MRVAVTGATGFVGRHVVAALGRRGIVPTTTRVDIHNPPADAFQRLGSPDVLVHLAWAGLPNYKSPVHLEFELPKQERFLELLVDSGLRCLVITGTCFEYGMQSGQMSEEMEPRPFTPYAIAKDMLRRRLEALKAEKSLALTWARLFYLYGEGQAEGSLLPQLRRAVERGDRVFNMSGGQQLRDYMPVEEVADSIVTLALSGVDNGTVNICSGKPVSVADLVREWIDRNHWTIDLNLGHYTYPDYEPMEFWGDRSKLDRLLARHEAVTSGAR